MQNQLNSFRGDFNSKFDAIDSKFDDVNVGLQGVNVRLDKLNKSLESVYDQNADLTKFRTMVSDKLTIVSKDVKFVKHKVQETEEDVFTMY